MKWTRVAILVLGSGWFFLASCTAGLFVGTRVVAALDARDVSNGDTVHSQFSVVFNSSENDPPFGALTLRDIERMKEAAGEAADSDDNAYILPKPGGQFDGGSSSYSFEVLEETNDGQIIEVVETYKDGDNTIWSRYKATASSVTPISSRMFYFGYMFAAFPYAIGFAAFVYVIGRLLQHRYRQIGGTASIE